MPPNSRGKNAKYISEVHVSLAEPIRDSLAASSRVCVARKQPLPQHHSSGRSAPLLIKSAAAAAAARFQREKRPAKANHTSSKTKMTLNQRFERAQLSFVRSFVRSFVCISSISEE
jgi:hypothetical protein